MHVLQAQVARPGLLAQNGGVSSDHRTNQLATAHPDTASEEHSAEVFRQYITHILKIMPTLLLW